MAKVGIEIDERLIGKYFLRVGLIPRETLDFAIVAQRDLPFLRLGEILIGVGAITFDDLRMALYRQLADTQLGQLLVRRRLVSPSDVDRALAVQASERDPRYLGEILAELGVVDRDTIQECLEELKSYQDFQIHLISGSHFTTSSARELAEALAVQEGSLGFYLIREGFTTREAIARAVGIQADLPFLRLGEILIGTKAISFRDMLTAIYLQYSQSLLGTILVRRRHCTREQVDEALELQQKSGESRRRIGEILVDLGYATTEQVEGAVAERELAYDNRLVMSLKQHFDVDVTARAQRV